MVSRSTLFLAGLLLEMLSLMQRAIKLLMHQFIDKDTAVSKLFSMRVIGQFTVKSFLCINKLSVYIRSGVKPDAALHLVVRNDKQEKTIALIGIIWN